MRTSCLRCLISFATLAIPLSIGACSDDGGRTSDTLISETSVGDGDGDPATGDGDGDPTTGDGDGDPTTTGDGDGDPTTTGDGDGDSDPVCGNGVVEGDEECDDGNMTDSDECLNSCIAAACGDGIVYEGVEECDDGNMVDDDGCNNACELLTCGDGVVQGEEECDDGNDIGTDACTNACTNAVCGDGSVWEGNEECDDGNDMDSDECLNSCVAAACGDGIVYEGVEDCDDGNDLNDDACVEGCVAASCGDGYVEEGNEACDDGVNDGSYGGCENDCSALGPFCGDNNVDMEEECDDGNDVDNDGCSNSCTLPVCGNDCFGEQGCETADGRCVRFTCAQGNQNAATACDTCFGWSQITYQNWLNDGYCEDIIDVYRDNYQMTTMCGGGGAVQCCADAVDCEGSDNAWHFHNGQSAYFTGPCLGCNNDANCTFWNNATNTTYLRLTACEAP